MRKITDISLEISAWEIEKMWYEHRLKYRNRFYLISGDGDTSQGINMRKMWKDVIKYEKEDVIKYEKVSITKDVKRCEKMW